MQNNRSIMHIDMDTFFVSVERLKNPKLFKKPVIVGSDQGRGIVASCSYEARQFGVHSGMSGKLARQICPHAIFVKGSREEYSKFSGMVKEIIHEEVPMFEAHLDEFYIDMTGFERFYGCLKLSEKIMDRIRKETHLPVSTALSSSKTTSKVGTGEAKPNGERYINYGKEKVFLAPLSIRKLPGMGSKTGKLIYEMGLRTIGDMQVFPVEMLQPVLGKYAFPLWKKANGNCTDEVIPYRLQKSISKERTFGDDTTDIAFLKSKLSDLAEKISFELRSKHKLTGCITVKIRYSNFETVSCQTKIPYTSNDHVILEKVVSLFDKLYDKRLLIRLVGVRFSDLVGGNYQIKLFEDTYQDIKLMEALDNIKNKFGVSAVMKGSSVERKVK